MNPATEVAKRLLQIKAIKLSPQNPFTWASGIQSPIYCDNRVALSYPEVRNYLKEAFVQKATAFPAFDTIAGVATAGIAHGALLADALQLPFVYVRDKAKAHGRQNRIEGHLTGKEKVLVIEDLISTGGSSIKAVAALREAGCEVVGVLAIFTYGFKKAERTFADADCLHKTLSDYPTLLEEAAASGYIDRTELEHLENWRRKTGE